MEVRCQQRCCKKEEISRGFLFCKSRIWDFLGDGSEDSWDIYVVFLGGSSLMFWSTFVSSVQCCFLFQLPFCGLLTGGQSVELCPSSHEIKSSRKSCFEKGSSDI